MNEEKIVVLEEKIAGSYMYGKLSYGIEEYISTFMDVYHASKKILLKLNKTK